MTASPTRPLIEAQRRRFEHPDASPEPVFTLRRQLRDQGAIDASDGELALREQYPDLDRGVYCANHSMGKPSARWHREMARLHGELGRYGIDAWEAGGWAERPAEFRDRVERLLGVAPGTGDVGHFSSFSDALSALLFGLDGGQLLTTDGHFITGHHIHRVWAERTGADVVDVPLTPDGSCPADRVIDALTPETAIVSLAQGYWRTGWVQDIEAIGAAIRVLCPDAVFAVDLYQTLGTIPLDVSRLPTCTALMGGGIKQLRAGTGAGFGWFSNPLLARLKPTRAGWFGHRDPMAFDRDFEAGEGAAMFRTGAPDIVGMTSLICEIDVLAGATGDLASALQAVQRRTRAQVERAIARCDQLDLEVVGRDWPMERRAAFFGIRLKRGAEVVSALAEEGVAVDFRSDLPGGEVGTLRMSACSVSFDYELAHTLERIAALR